MLRRIVVAIEIIKQSLFPVNLDGHKAIPSTVQKQSGHFNPYRVTSVAILASENAQLSAVQ